MQFFVTFTLLAVICTACSLMKDVLLSMLSVFCSEKPLYFLAGSGEVEMVGVTQIGQGWKIGRVNREIGE